jgi:hypothetical protein
MGRAKGQQKGGSGLILREDQMEWQDAVRRREGERKKEEKRAAKGVLGGWDDPDVSGGLRAVGEETDEEVAVVAGDYYCRYVWEGETGRTRDAEYRAREKEPKPVVEEAMSRTRLSELDGLLRWSRS